LIVAKDERLAVPTPPDDESLRSNVGRAMLAGAGLLCALVLYGPIRFPAIWTGPSRDRLAVFAGLAVAAGYVIIGWLALRRRSIGNSPAFEPAARLGLGGGLLFAVSMLGEYLVPHGERAGPWIALATFSLFFLLLFTAGLMARLAGARLRCAPLAAVWAALIASECWFILLLSVYYAFLGTPQEARFLEVDQAIADFQRSGQADLRAFLFGDYMGAGFFHSLLAPLFAVPLGYLGGLAGTLVRRR
jgi:hypothetical protein